MSAVESNRAKILSFFPQDSCSLDEEQVIRRVKECYVPCLLTHSLIERRSLRGRVTCFYDRCMRRDSKSEKRWEKLLYRIMNRPQEGSAKPGWLHRCRGKPISCPLLTPFCEAVASRSLLAICLGLMIQRSSRSFRVCLIAQMEGGKLLILTHFLSSLNLVDSRLPLFPA